MSLTMMSKAGLRLVLGLVNLVVLGLVMTSVAEAGPQYVGRDGLAVGGYDVVSYHTGETPVEGLETITTQYNGVTWQFASEAHRDLFLADPMRYAPAYDGHCAYAAAHGNKTRTDPLAYAVVDDVLYLNFSPRIQNRWAEDVPGYLERSEANWPELVDEPAARPSRWGG